MNPTRIYWTANIPEIKSPALLYFAASMFWRGSIHTWNQDGSIPVELGPFGESFREYLMGQADFPDHCAILVTVREGKEIDRLTHAPIGERRELFHVYRFPMPGLAFTLAVGKNIPDNLRQGCFAHAPGNPIIVTGILEKWLTRMAAKARQKNFDNRVQASLVGKR